MPIMTGLSGNEMYCLALKGLTPGELVIGNSVHSLGFLGGVTAGFQNLLGGQEIIQRQDADATTSATSHHPRPRHLDQLQSNGVCGGWERR